MWSKKKGIKTKKRKLSKPKSPAEPKTPVSAFLIFQKEMKLVEMAGVTLSSTEMLGKVAGPGPQEGSLLPSSAPSFKSSLA